MEKSHTLLELEKIEEKYRSEYLQAESIWNVSRTNMIREALKEGWNYPITELERYTGKRIDEIAAVFCNEDGLRRKVKILNTDNDNFISVKESGFLDWISVNSWGDIEAEDYEEYIFSEDVGNGIMMRSDTGECIAGFPWISLAGETKRRGYRKNHPRQRCYWRGNEITGMIAETREFRHCHEPRSMFQVTGLVKVTYCRNRMKAAIECRTEFVI